MTQTMSPPVPATVGPIGDVCFSPGAVSRPGLSTGRDTVLDLDTLSGQVRALIAETDLSYRQLEAHSGVPAPIIYRMAQGAACEKAEVRRFAAFALHRAASEAAHGYWRSLVDRLTVDVRRGTPPVLQANGAQNIPVTAGGAPLSRTELSPADVAALYAGLAGKDSREAVVHLLRALRDSEQQLPSSSERPSR